MHTRSIQTFLPSFIFRLVPVFLSAVLLFSTGTKAQAGDVVSNTELTFLSIGPGLNEPFDPLTTSYSVTTPYSVELDNLIAISAGSEPDVTLTYSLNGSFPAPLTSGSAQTVSPFEPGLNTVEVIVSATGSQPVTYTISVLMLQKGDHIDVIATSGSAVNGQPGLTKYRFFGPPSINEQGEIAYFARISDSNGNGSTPALLVGTEPTVYLKKGDPAPGMGDSFYTFLNPLLNDDGELAFVARLGAAGLLTSEDHVLYSTLSGSLAPIIRQGAPLPTPAGAVFKFFRQVAVSPDYVAFVGDMVSGPGGVSDATNTGLWLSDGTNLTLVLRDGDTLDLPGGMLTVDELARSFDSLGTLVAGDNGLGQGNGIAGDQIVVRVRGTNGRQAVLALSGTNITEIASTGTPAPAHELGAELLTFGLPTQCACGYAAFLANARTGLGEVNALNNTAIYTDVFGSLEMVAREGDPAPGTSGTFANFKTPVLGNGSVVYQATLRGPVPAVMFNTNTAIYENRSLLAREGSDAPEIKGARFKAFNSLAKPDAFHMGTLLLAKLVVGPGAVTPGSDTGLWMVDDLLFKGQEPFRTRGVNFEEEIPARLRLILREGQKIGTRTIRTFSVLSRVPYSGSQRRSFNNEREIVARVVFTNNSQSIIKITLAKPFFEEQTK